MPAAPIAKGVIIMCAVLIAAGYTVYENREQVMDLVDKTRRKISLAMHQFADEIMPPSQEQSTATRMAHAGRPDGLSRRPSRTNSRSRSRRNSADSITLRGGDEKGEGTSRDNYMADSALRYRPAHRGFVDAETSNNTEKSPFDDDNRVLFDASAEVAPPLPPRRPVLLQRSSGSNASSETLSPAMSEKHFPLAEASVPMIPAVLPVVIPAAVATEDDTTAAPPLPPRPASPEAETVQTPTAEPSTNEASPSNDEHNMFSNSQPYWAIQQWTEDVTGVGDEEHVESEPEAEDHSAVQSLHSESESPSVIDSDEGESEADDRVEIVSDMASDTDGWSEVGSTFSEADSRM